MSTAELAAGRKNVNVDYHSDYSAVSKTMLNLFCQSRLEYYHTYVTRELPPKPQTKPMLAGTVLHAMLLEDRAFSDLVQPYPDSVLKCNGDLDGKKAAALRADYPGVTFLKQSDCDNVQDTVSAVMQDDQLAKLIARASHREKRFDATIEGVDCKCKPDIICDLGGQVVVYDLKFSEAVDPDSWRRACKRLRYWLQDAHYSAVFESIAGKPVQFRFCLIETKFPYRVQWKWYDPTSRETSRESHRRLISDLAVCQASGDWQDHWGSVCVLEPWDVDTDELVEVDQ